MNRLFSSMALFCFISLPSIAQHDIHEPVATFSIVAVDTVTGELGVAVASRFFCVGSVVPWAKAGVGAVATQSFANTSFGWRGLELLQQGATPAQTLDILLRNDDQPANRQVGIVSAKGISVTYTGTGCNPWAGGRSGPGYAIQGNILTGEDVVTAVEKTFLATKGSLPDRMYAALCAGDAKGGDSRGRQSAAMLIVREGAGYGGYTDRAIDIRVDDHPDPFGELGRLLKIAKVNYAWNMGWTAFTKKDYADALNYQESAAKLDPENPELLYDLAVIRTAAGRKEEAVKALAKALSSNPKLKQQARNDKDLEQLKSMKEYQEIVR